jgi:LPS export ABC transporter protein LptC
MKRLSLLFLVLFVALAGGLAATIAWNARGRPTPAATAPKQQADYRISEVHINETLEGNLRWTLDADQAEMFDREQRTIMRNVAIQLFSKEAEWRVTALEGVLHNQKRDVTLKGEVRLTSNEGLTLTTTRLIWENAQRRLSTPEPVEITREGVTITGEDLDVRLEDQHAVLGKRVHVVIHDRRNVNFTLFPRSGT